LNFNRIEAKMITAINSSAAIALTLLQTMAASEAALNVGGAAPASSSKIDLTQQNPVSGNTLLAIINAAHTDKTTQAASTKSGAAGSENSSDEYTTAGAVANLTSVAASASGATASVMNSVIAAISNDKDNFYGNVCEGNNAAEKANQKLTSQQLSDILLSGEALIWGITPTTRGIDFGTLSLNDLVSGLKDAISGSQDLVDRMSQWLQDGMPTNNKYFGNTCFQNMSLDENKKIIEENNANIAQMKTTYAGVTKAIAEGTVKIQKPSDVAGLDYVEGDYEFTQLSAQSYEGRTTKDGSYNYKFLEQHSSNGWLTGMAGVGIYISW